MNPLRLSQFLSLVLASSVASAGDLPAPSQMAFSAFQQDPHYFAPITRLKEHEAEFLNSPLKDAYLNDLGTYLSWVGDHSAAIATFDQLFGRPQMPATAIPAEYKQTDAISELVKRAQHHSVLMINEAHHIPQGRMLTLELLEPLYQEGFRYLAGEAFEGNVSEMMSDGFPKVIKSGFYTNEPLFGQIVREAIRVGYQLVAYEHIPNCDVWSDVDSKCQNLRERGQAENISKILQKDPQAKILVHAGYGHIDKLGRNKWIPMARYFKELTQIEPFAVDQTTMREHSTREFENPYYQNVETSFSKPFLMKKADGSLFVDPNAQGHYDVQIFSPRSNDRHGRPEWMDSFGRYRRTRIDNSVCKGTFPCLVQAYRHEELIPESVPVDQFIVNANQTTDLLLPKGRFVIRSSEHNGNVLGTHEVEIQ